MTRDGGAASALSGWWRVLTLEARHGWGRWGLPVFLLLEAVCIGSRGQEWAQEWLWTTSWMNSIIVLLGPAVAGLSAAESLRARRTTGPALRRADVSHTFLAHLARVLAVGCWAVLAHLLGFAAAWWIAWRTHAALGVLDWRLVVLSVALLLAWSALGGLIGWWAPVTPIPVIVALLGYVLPGLQWVPGRLLLVGGATGSLSGMTYRPDLLVAQAGLWVSLPLACALACTARTGRHSSSRWLAAGAALLVLAAGAHVVRAGPDDLEPVRDVALACAGPFPQVCVPEEYRPRLAELDQRARPVISQLESSLGPTGVTRVVGQLPTASLPQPRTDVPVELLSAEDIDLVHAPTLAMAYVRVAARCPEEAMNDSRAEQLLRVAAAAAPGVVPAAPGQPSGPGLGDPRTLLRSVRSACG